MLLINILCTSTAYCVVAVESVGRQVPIAFLDRVKEDFTKRYGGGKAATAAANSLNREFGYVLYAA
jgi:vesicle-associated membrane protein 72